MRIAIWLGGMVFFGILNGFLLGWFCPRMKTWIVVLIGGSFGAAWYAFLAFILWPGWKAFG